MLRRSQYACLRLALLLLVCSALVSISTPAQTKVFRRWVSTIENFATSDIEFDEVGNSYPARPMVADSQGNSYLIGTATVGTGSGTHDEMLTLKYDANGHLLWKAWLGNSVNPAQGVEIALDSAGNVYALGSIAITSGSTEFATAKYNANGIRQWVDYFASPGFPQNIPSKIATSAGGDVYITGTSASPTNGAAFGVTIKYGTGGNRAWSKSVENFNTVGSSGLDVDAQGNVYSDISEVLVTGTDNRSFIYKYDPNGNQLNLTSAGGLSSLITTSPMGNSFFVGQPFEIPESDFARIVAEFKADGTSWQDAVTMSGNFPSSIASNQDGTVYVSPVPGLTKFSATGAILWAVQDSGLLAANSFGNVYVAGQNVSKYDPEGKLLWSVPFTGPSNAPATPTAIATAGGGLIVTGSTTINGVPASVTIDYVQDAASLTPAALTFSSEALGKQSAAQFVTLKNTAEQSLAITGISTSGDFRQTNNCPSTIQPNTSCTISVTFTPSETGSRTGTLTVTDPWAGSPQTVKLSGTGTN